MKIAALEAGSIEGKCCPAAIGLWVILSVPAHLPAQRVQYGTGSWDAEALGNHRALVQVDQSADAVWTRIPWRRRDPEPEKKNIVVVDAKTGKKVSNLLRIDITRHAGDIVFQAEQPGTYYIYYMPYVTKGRNYPIVTYQAPEDTAAAEWKSRTQSALLRSDRRLPQAVLVEMQSIDRFSSFYPMEITASPEEVESLLAAQSGEQFLLFPEDRTNPIRMSQSLPEKWAREGPRQQFAGEAARGEFYAFQVGLFAGVEEIKDVAIGFSDLQSQHGKGPIPAAAFRCINTGGINWDGTAFRKIVGLRKGEVQALWFGVQIPKDAAPGLYRSRLQIEPQGMKARLLDLLLTVRDSVLSNAGDDEPWRHSRLRWLDSRLALDDEIVRPFTPIRVRQSRIQILGRSVTLGPSGLPAQIDSYFSPEVTRINNTSRALLSAPMEFVFEGPEGRRVKWSHAGPEFIEQKAGIVEWRSLSTSGPLRLKLRAAMEFDGFIQYRVSLTSSETVRARDVRLEIPLVKDAARYMMGLGLRGGLRPPAYDWAWDIKKNQDGAWLGDANIGFQFSLRAENYSRPLNTNFYQSKPLNMPPSWFNSAKGGITMRESETAAVLLKLFSGERTIQPGQELHFDFTLLLTPFKPLDPQFQWKTRFFHSFKPVDEALRSGANVINVHHANDVNPYINYPFIHQAQMKEYVEEAHRKGLKVKIYYTIRELSNRAPEIFALRSLGTEIFTGGPGGGFSWLQEHLGSNYIAAWFVPQLKDAAIINSGMSRWHNYYVEGLDWLVKKMQIDGLYLDDVAFDRTTMKRVRKVLDRGRPEAIIDLHSANQYNPRDGFTNSANLYLEHFPYINRLWFGEYFDPDSPPDFWFTEMSGIPYGLMGEMLQDGGNRWRGMLYGMTSRMPYDGSDPSPIWRIWDDFRIQESEMVGYWSPSCPVKTDHKEVLATAYVKAGKTLVSLASWAKEDVNVRLTANWKALGLTSGASNLVAPEVRGFQPAARFKPGDSIPVSKGKGWLLIIGI